MEELSASPEESKQERKLAKARKLTHKKEIIFTLSIFLMLVVFLGFIIFSNNLVLYKNAVGAGYATTYNSKNTQFVDGRFIIDFQKELVTNMVMKVEKEPSQFMVRLYGSGEDVSIKIANSDIMTAYGKLDGSLVTMDLFPEGKTVVLNDTIHLELPKSSIFSAFMTLDSDLENPTPGIWDEVGLNGFAVIPGLNNVINKMDLICDGIYCHSDFIFDSNIPGSIMIKDLTINYFIADLDYSKEIRDYCSSYPCDVPMTVTSASKGTVVVQILGEDENSLAQEDAKDTAPAEESPKVTGDTGQDLFIDGDSLLLEGRMKVIYQLILVLMLIGFFLTLVYSKKFK